jgi:hypothetical protein
VNLLADHHAEGRRFEPVELIEAGDRVAVRLAVGLAGHEERVDVFKVFTFDATTGAAVLLEDCSGREHALALLA